MFIIGMIRDWDGSQYVVLALGLFIAAAITIGNMYTIISCETFPEKVILEYIDETINSNQTNYR